MCPLLAPNGKARILQFCSKNEFGICLHVGGCEYFIWVEAKVSTEISTDFHSLALRKLYFDSDSKSCICTNEKKSLVCLSSQLGLLYP